MSQPPEPPSKSDLKTSSSSPAAAPSPSTSSSLSSSRPSAINLGSILAKDEDPTIVEPIPPKKVRFEDGTRSPVPGRARRVSGSRVPRPRPSSPPPPSPSNSSASSTTTTAARVGTNSVPIRGSLPTTSEFESVPVTSTSQCPPSAPLPAASLRTRESFYTHSNRRLRLGEDVVSDANERWVRTRVNRTITGRDGRLVTFMGVGHRRTENWRGARWRDDICDWAEEVAWETRAERS